MIMSAYWSSESLLRVPAAAHCDSLFFLLCNSPHSEKFCRAGFAMLQDSCSPYEKLVADSVLAMARWDVDALIPIHVQVTASLKCRISHPGRQYCDNPPPIHAKYIADIMYVARCGCASSPPSTRRIFGP